MIGAMQRLARNAIGAVAVEFALVAPVFLMFLFLMLDGGRMLFTQQSLNEVATATARCAALRATGCTSAANAQNWATARALTRGGMTLSDAKVELSVTCNSVSSMAKVTVSTAWKKSGMGLLPQSVAPATLTSVACFPIKV
jgi:Flp pilus assembly protein TadG